MTDGARLQTLREQRLAGDVNIGHGRTRQIGLTPNQAETPNGANQKIILQPMWTPHKRVLVRETTRAVRYRRK